LEPLRTGIKAGHTVDASQRWIPRRFMTSWSYLFEQVSPMDCSEKNDG
jgi:hypothetical protein